jgi:transcriptional regulator
MNQDKPDESIRRILRELRSSGPYANPRLADRMAKVNGLSEDDR